MSPRPLIIAIDGLTHQGRTTLASNLAARLQEGCIVSRVHLDPQAMPNPAFPDHAVTIQRPSYSHISSWTRTATIPVHPLVGQASSSDVLIVEGEGAGAFTGGGPVDVVIWAASGPDAKAEAHRPERSEEGVDHTITGVDADGEVELKSAGDFADIYVASPSDANVPDQILHALHYLPPTTQKSRPLPAWHLPNIIFERIDGRPHTPRLFEALFSGSANAVWLDSSLKQGAADETSRATHSIMADDGGLLGQAALHRSGNTTVTAGAIRVRSRGPFFDWLSRVWSNDRSQALPAGYNCEFSLGWLGYLGYELKRESGGSDMTAATPDASLLFAARAVVVDHRTGSTWILALEAKDAAEWMGAARSAVLSSIEHPAAPKLPRDSALPPFQTRDCEKDYKAKIKSAQKEITEGNSYEVCLTTELTSGIRTGKDGLDPWELYLALRKKNPAPFSSFLKFGPLTVASTSPERFLRITAGGAIRAEPIKGTRPRSSHAGDDVRLRADLLSSPKDRAENIMIVDLLRNDLSHFAIPGSLQVSRLCVVESYATVHQMVSTIDAQLKPGLPRSHAVAACFPPGSMTGAPKISTMAILDSLEKAPRGVYSGAIGYFSLNGAADLSVAIRTLVINADASGYARCSLGIGGAITSDSSPDEEYEEIKTKAYGVLSALGVRYPSD